MDRLTKIFGAIILVFMFTFWIVGWEKPVQQKVYMDPIYIQGDPWACVVEDCEEFEDFEDVDLEEILSDQS